MNKSLLISALLCFAVYPIAALIASHFAIKHSENIDASVMAVFYVWTAVTFTTGGIAIRKDWRQHHAVNRI